MNKRMSQTYYEIHYYCFIESITLSISAICHYVEVASEIIGISHPIDKVRGPLEETEYVG